MTKPTLATLKSFIRKNRAELMIKVGSRFDGMTDMVERIEGAGYAKAENAEHHHENNLGIQGAWCVRGSRDSISAFVSADGYVGYHVYNCCGSFDVAIKV